MRLSPLSRIRDGRLALNPKALMVMSSFRQDTLDKREAGGVMLGRHILDSSDVVVDEVTVPMSGDQRSRTSFFRGRVNHQQAIDEAWRQSGGTCTYLGEWHTHPEAIPNPSWVDLREWQRKLHEDVYAGAGLFFVIVGINLTRVWEGRRGCRQFQMIGQFPTVVNSCPKPASTSGFQQVENQKQRGAPCN